MKVLYSFSAILGANVTACYHKGIQDWVTEYAYIAEELEVVEPSDHKYVPVEYIKRYGSFQENDCNDNELWFLNGYLYLIQEDYDGYSLEVMSEESRDIVNTYFEEY